MSDEDAVEAGLEAASEYVSQLPMGQRTWDKKEYRIAETAAKAAVDAARAEIAALRDSRDTFEKLAQRYWDDLQTARDEIAALTKERDEQAQATFQRELERDQYINKWRRVQLERDAMKAVVEAARKLHDSPVPVWGPLHDALATLDAKPEKPVDNPAADPPQ